VAAQFVPQNAWNSRFLHFGLIIGGKEPIRKVNLPSGSHRMPTTDCIAEISIRNNITRAIKEVFSTMLSQHVQLVETAKHSGDEMWPPLAGGPTQHDPYVVGTVGFIGGMNGLLYLYLPEKFARLVTCHMLGMRESEVMAEGDEVVNDAIGELTNMTVGVFKNGLSESGFSCRLTIPSILRGTNFTIEPISSANRYIFYFECAGHRLVADILLKSGE
jgi:chemotaxis protein CheX